MKTKRAGILTKLVVLTLLVVTATTLLDLRTQLVEVQAQQDALNTQVERQTQENQVLSAAIAGSGDPDRIEAIAREKLGLVAPGEIIFYDASN